MKKYIIGYRNYNTNRRGWTIKKAGSMDDAKKKVEKDGKYTGGKYTGKYIVELIFEI